MHLARAALVAACLACLAAPASARAEAESEHFLEGWKDKVVDAVAALKGGHGGGHEGGGDLGATGPKQFFNYALSGSGGMIFWHFGVGAVLHNLTRAVEQASFAGISGGAITSTLLATGVSPEKVIRDMVAAATKDCDAKPFECLLLVPGGFVPVLQAVLKQELPENTAAIVNAADNLHIFASNLNVSEPSINPNVTPIYFDLANFGLLKGYLNKEDVINATTASAWVPCGVGPTVYSDFRGHAFMDGGASASMQALCDSMQDNGNTCVEVLAVTLGPLGNQSEPITFNTSVAHKGLTPYPPIPLDPSKLVLPLTCEGYRALNKRTAGSDFWPVLPVLPDNKALGICPGCRVKTGYTATDIHLMSLFQLGNTSVGTNFFQTAIDLFKLGAEEALAWAAEVGLLSEQ